MNILGRILVSGFVGATATLLTFGANATVLDIDAQYNGGTITLDAGSDDPIGASLVAGDMFNFNLQAVGDDFWKVDVTESYFPFNAFTTDEVADRDATFALDLLLDGVSQFSEGPSNITNSTVHVGTNGIDLVAGLMFDEIVLDYTLLSTSGAGQTTLIDYFIGGEVPGGFREGISYNRGVPNPAPVPATLALFGLGLLALGGRRRQRR